MTFAKVLADMELKSEPESSTTTSITESSRAMRTEASVAFSTESAHPEL